MSQRRNRLAPCGTTQVVRDRWIAGWPASYVARLYMGHYLALTGNGQTHSHDLKYHHHELFNLLPLNLKSVSCICVLVCLPCRTLPTAHMVFISYMFVAIDRSILHDVTDIHLKVLLWNLSFFLCNKTSIAGIMNLSFTHLLFILSYVFAAEFCARRFHSCELTFFFDRVLYMLMIMQSCYRG